MTMFEQFEEIRRRVAALENERARNITALVEDGVTVKGRLDALEHEKRTLFHALDTETAIREDIGRRVSALEARLPPAKLAPSCVGCGGPVEPARHDYVSPTCYQCLPPPEPLPTRQIGTGTVVIQREPDFEPKGIALPDYILAPAPDYRIAEPDEDPCYECGTKHGPDENTQCPLSSVYDGPSISDPCSCEESEALRADLRVTLDDLNRKIDLLGEARSELERLRAEAQGERDKTARAHNALRDRESAELAALQELDEQTASLREAEADAKQDGESVLALALALAEATERASVATREMSRIHRMLDEERVSFYRTIREEYAKREALDAEVAAANALTARLRRVVVEAYALPNRAALRANAWRYLDLIRDEVAEVDSRAKEEPTQHQ
jgi:hypothetical protein